MILISSNDRFHYIKIELVTLIGSVKCYPEFYFIHSIWLKPFNSILHDDICFEWTPESDNLFNEITTTTSLSKDADLASPNTARLFHFTVDGALIGLGASLFQNNTTIKMQVVSPNSKS